MASYDDPYKPWERSAGEGMENLSDLTLEELAKRRMQGNIRQREGMFPSFVSRLIGLFRGSGQQMQ